MASLKAKAGHKPGAWQPMKLPMTTTSPRYLPADDSAKPPRITAGLPVPSKRASSPARRSWTNMPGTEDALPAPPARQRRQFRREPEILRRATAHSCASLVRTSEALPGKRGLCCARCAARFRLQSSKQRSRPKIARIHEVAKPDLSRRWA